LFFLSEGPAPRTSTAVTSHRSIDRCWAWFPGWFPSGRY